MNSSHRAWNLISPAKNRQHPFYHFRTSLVKRKVKITLTLHCQPINVFSTKFQRYNVLCPLRSLDLPLTFCLVFVCPYDTYYHGIQRQSTPLGSKSSRATLIREETSRNSWPLLLVTLYQTERFTAFSLLHFVFGFVKTYTNLLLYSRKN